MSTDKLLFKGLEIEHITKPSLKHSYLSIDPHAKIILKTPRVSQRFIENLLREKELWLHQSLEKIKQNNLLTFKLGSEILFFGEIHSVFSSHAVYLRKLLEKNKPETDKGILDCYDKFYKHSAKEYLSQRVEYFSKIMHLEYSALKFRKMKSRWGSCSSKRSITLNTQLMKVSPECIDYVVVHELAHIVHMNHSKAFHALVRKYIPNANNLRKELKQVYLGFK